MNTGYMEINSLLGPMNNNNIGGYLNSVNSICAGSINGPCATGNQMQMFGPSFCGTSPKALDTMFAYNNKYQSFSVKQNAEMEEFRVLKDLVLSNERDQVKKRLNEIVEQYKGKPGFNNLSDKEIMAHIKSSYRKVNGSDLVVDVRENTSGWVSTGFKRLFSCGLSNKTSANELVDQINGTKDGWAKFGKNLISGPINWVAGIFSGW